MKRRLFLPFVMILSLFAITACHDDDTTVDEYVDCEIVVSTTVFTMNANAEVEIPFLVVPANTDVTNLGIICKSYSGSSSDTTIPSILYPKIKSIAAGSVTGTYVATVKVCNSAGVQFVPESQYRYSLSFTNCELYLGDEDSNDFAMTFTQTASSTTK